MTTGAITQSQLQYLPASMLAADGTVKPEFAEAAPGIAAAVAARAEGMPPSERALFLATLQSPSFAPDAAAFVDDLDGALDRAQGAATELSALIDSGDSGDVLGRLMIMMTAQMRKDALESRLAARETAKDQMLAEADTLKDAASKVMTGAIVGLVLSVVAGAIALGGSIMSGVGKAKEANAKLDELSLANGGASSVPNASKTVDLPDVDVDVGAVTKSIAETKKLGGIQDAIGSALTAVGQASQGVGRSADGFIQADVKTTEAEGKVAAAQAEEARGQADIARDTQQALNDLIKSMIEFVKQLKEAEVNQMAAITKA